MVTANAADRITSRSQMISFGTRTIQDGTRL
jgi:hypothetical protein